MGGTAPSKQKFVYAVPVTEPKKGESAVYRAPAVKDGLLTNCKSGWTTVQELLLEKFKNVPNHKWLGRRTDEDGNLLDYYTWETFAQIETLAQQIGSGIENLGLTEVKAQYEDYKIKFISIYSANSREWVLVDHANSLYGYTTMPLYDTLGERAK